MKNIFQAKQEIMAIKPNHQRGNSFYFLLHGDYYEEVCIDENGKFYVFPVKMGKKDFYALTYVQAIGLGLGAPTIETNNLYEVDARIKSHKSILSKSFIKPGKIQFHGLR